jgi:hypothetical protein
LAIGNIHSDRNPYQGQQLGKDLTFPAVLNALGDDRRTIPRFEWPRLDENKQPIPQITQAEIGLIQTNSNIIRQQMRTGLMGNVQMRAVASEWANQFCNYSIQTGETQDTRELVRDLSYIGSTARPVPGSARDYAAKFLGGLSGVANVADIGGTTRVVPIEQALFECLMAFVEGWQLGKLQARVIAFRKSIVQNLDTSLKAAEPQIAHTITQLEREPTQRKIILDEVSKKVSGSAAPEQGRAR